jgi:Meckelin (Transmembrane protein 67)
VPVFIKNFQDKVGNRPNLDDSTGYEAGWRLVRKFFIFDTKSGVEGADIYRKGEVSTVIRYAKSITMRVTIDPANEEMIYTPLFDNQLSRTLKDWYRKLLAHICWLLDRVPPRQFLPNWNLKGLARWCLDSSGHLSLGPNDRVVFPPSNL